MEFHLFYFILRPRLTFPLFSLVCSIVNLNHLFNLTLQYLKEYFPFLVTAELEKTRHFNLLYIYIAGVLSSILQQGLLPLFPLKEMMFSKCRPQEQMIRSRLTLHVGPQLSIVPMWLFFFTFPERPRKMVYYYKYQCLCCQSPLNYYRYIVCKR